MTIVSESRKLVTVPSADDMDDETFILHFNKRHASVLAGLSALRLPMSPYVLQCYRTYHDWLHRPETTFPSQQDLDHEHVKAA